MKNITNIIETACRNAKNISNETGSPGEIHRNRSINFVECLAQLLHQQYADQENIATLSKYNPDYRKMFGVNELLFDITICRYDSVNSGKSDKDLAYITQGLWAVESEMEKNKRAALYDFNKLVLADAENKLFVGPWVHESEESDYLRILAAAASYCKGNLFAALIPHPRAWDEVEPKWTQLWHWKGGWQPVV